MTWDVAVWLVTCAACLVGGFAVGHARGWIAAMHDLMDKAERRAGYDV